VRKLLLSLFSLVHFGCPAAPAATPARCLYVSSYHSGYEWNDGIEHGLESALQGRCDLVKFYMDGKRHLDEPFAKAKAREAYELILTLNPDVVIAADDSASKYLVMPYLKDKAVPVVFCGLNWTAEPYGYPYKNSTGMIEVGPIEPLMNEVRGTVKGARRGVFLSADEITQRKEFAMTQEIYRRVGMEVTHKAVTRMADWESSYAAAQKHNDFLVIGNYAGIADWDPERARRVVFEHSRRFSVAYLDWMAPFAMLTMSKIADEQGEWAGKATALILSGTAPSKIPVVANRRWNMYANGPLLQKAGLRLSPEIVRKAAKVE
jgi:ABC-type uncharacterized transport system substrate-binding protein